MTGNAQLGIEFSMIEPWLVYLALCFWGIAAVFLIAGFILIIKIERAIPLLERSISLSVVSGMLATLVSLGFREFHPPPDLWFPMFGNPEPALLVYGWPMAWYGYELLGILFEPLAFLIDVVSWSWVGAIVLLPVGLLKHYSPHFIYKLIYPGVAVFITLSPLAAIPLVPRYRAYLQAEERRQDEILQQAYDDRLKQNIEATKRAIHLESCTDHLIPSNTLPGVFDIAVEATVTVQAEHEYRVEAFLQDNTRSRRLSQSEINQPLGLGTHLLQFTFPTADSSGLLIPLPGPDRVWVGVTGVMLGKDYFVPDRGYTARRLGISAEGLEITCQTQPYQLEELRSAPKP